MLRFQGIQLVKFFNSVRFCAVCLHVDSFIWAELGAEVNAYLCASHCLLNVYIRASESEREQRDESRQAVRRVRAGRHGAGEQAGSRQVAMAIPKARMFGGKK